MTSPNYDYEFQAGGSLAADAPTYIQRAADEALYRAVKAGKFAYVFNSRQMGKSSLRVQTENRLKAEGIRCAAIDLSTLGTEEVSAAQWYRSLIGELNRCLNLLPVQEVDAWLEKQVEVTPVYRLHRFIEDVLLVQIPDQRIVIFIDEIDSVLSLSFPASDFFALIRACYNRQVDNAAYRRLTFVLLGVTTPSQLIRDSSRTPFNIGQAIELTPLALERATGLTEGLFGWVAEPQQVLAEIFYWTGGQPYLTQRLCALVQEQAMEADSLPWIGQGEAAAAVSDLVQRHLIHNWETSDEQAHFKTMRDRLMRREHLANLLLGMYEQILTQGSIPKENSDPHMELRLSGLVVSSNGNLRVFNPIYAQIFDLAWVQRTQESLRPYAESFQAWLASDCTDESRLLRGHALAQAEAWSRGKGLSELDDRYLRESQAAENRDVKSALARSEALKQEIEERQQALEQFNQEAEIQIQKQNRRIRNRSRIAVVTLIASLIGGAFALGAIALFNNARDDLDTVREVAQLESAGLAAQEKFTRQETEAVWDAFKASYRANEIYERKGEEFLAYAPILTLQSKLNQLREVRIRGHQNYVNHSEFSPDGQQIITGSGDGTARLWDLSGKQLSVMEGHDAGISHVVFSPDGQQIATSSEDGTARLWDLSGKQLSVMEGHQDIVLKVVFHPDGLQIATCSLDGTVRIWDFQGETITTFERNTQGFRIDVSFSADGSYILISHTGRAELWDLQGRQIATMDDHKGDVLGQAFSPDSSRIVTVDTRSTLRLWDLQGNLLDTTQGPQGFVSSISFNPQKQKVITSGMNGSVHLWSLTNSKAISTYQEFKFIRGLALSPDNSYIAVESPSAEITLVDLFKGEKIEEEISGRDPTFSPNSKYVATKGDWKNGLVNIWNLKGDVIAYSDAYWGDRGLTGLITFSPDSQYLAFTINSNQTTRLWHFKSNQAINLEATSGDFFTRIVFSPSNKYIATGSARGVVKLWNLKGNEVLEKNDHSDWITDLIFSENGKYIAASGHNLVKIWNLQGDQITSIRGYSSSSRLAFSPDNKLIAIGNNFDGTVSLWDFGGEQTSTMPGHSTRIEHLAFSPDGKYIVVADDNDTVRIWTLDGRQIAQYQSSTNIWFGSENHAYLFKDWSKIFTVEQVVLPADVIKLWPVYTLDRLDSLLADACDRLTPYLMNNPDRTDEDRALCDLPPLEQKTTTGE